MIAFQGRTADKRSPLRALLACMALLAGAISVPSFSQADDSEPVILPASLDGDILQSCDTSAPPPGRLWMRGQIFTGESDRWGNLRSMGGWLHAGLHPRFSAGLGLAHCSEVIERSSGPSLSKQGLGDMRLFCKWRVLGDEETPHALSLRPVLRIPTGYDRDVDSLAAFTTRTVDFEVLGIAGFRTGLMDVYFNAGLSLPGGRHHNEGLAGLAARSGRLPLNLSLSGEYFLRYDIPTQGLRHSIFGAIAYPLPQGISVEVGVRKQLLDDEGSSAELGLRIGYGGWVHTPTSGSHSAQHPPARLHLLPLAVAISDPYGIGPDAMERLTPHLLGDAHLDLSTDPIDSRYLASVEILSIIEGTGRSISIPKLLATPQATLELAARLALRDTQYGQLLTERAIRFELRRGTGMILLPPGGDEDTWVPSAEVRRALRKAAAQRLAGEVHKAILAAVATVEGEETQ